MEKKETKQTSFMVPVIIGLSSLGFYLLLLLSIALISGKLPVLLDHAAIAGKCALMLSAMLCGSMTGQAAPSEKGRIRYGGWILFLALVFVIRLLLPGKTNSMNSWLNPLCIIFGGFVGLLLAGRNRKGKRRKRYYSP